MVVYIFNEQTRTKVPTTQAATVLTRNQHECYITIRDGKMRLIVIKTGETGGHA